MGGGTLLVVFQGIHYYGHSYYLSGVKTILNSMGINFRGVHKKGKYMLYKTNHNNHTEMATQTVWIKRGT